MTMQEGVLTWPYIPPDLSTLSPAPSQQQQDTASAIAVEWMWSRSARRYGTRSAVYRPQSVNRGQLGAWPGLGLQPFNGQPLDYPWLTGCDYGGLERQQILELPPPAVSVQQVVIEGTVVNPTVYRMEGNFLVRQDGGIWPQTQNMIAALGSPDTWAVTYTRGFPVTLLGQYATGRLFYYFLKQMVVGKPCELPYNTSAVSRGSVTIQRNTQKGAAAMTSPVPEVDQWLSLVNPNGLQSEPRVWSPDVTRNRAPFAGSYDSGVTAPQPYPVQQADWIVLGPTAPVPPNTPIGTIIFRTPS